VGEAAGLSGASDAGVGDGGQRPIDGTGSTRRGGGELTLTRHAHAAVRLAPVKAAANRKSRRALLGAVRTSAAAKATPGPGAARTQDFLYGDGGVGRMIAVDTAALMAIMLNEPEDDVCDAALEAEDDLPVSAVCGSHGAALGRIGE
jgi:hypothetical protein